MGVYQVDVYRLGSEGVSVPAPMGDGANSFAGEPSAVASPCGDAGDVRVVIAHANCLVRVGVRGTGPLYA